MDDVIDKLKASSQLTSDLKRHRKKFKGEL
jgi:hypothetical protein